MIDVIMITLSLFGGGILDVNKSSVASVEEYTCRTRHGKYGFFTSPTYSDQPCRKVTFNSGQDALVTDSREEILKKLK